MLNPTMRRLRYDMLRRYVRTRRFVVHNVLHADDPPHKLALGFAIAMFVTFTPTIGFQMGLAVLLAWLLGGNKAVGVPVVWLSNPATIVPIFYPCYRLGLWLLDERAMGPTWWNELATPPLEWWPRVQFYWEKFLEIWLPLWAGCLVVATILGVISYFAMLRIVIRYRQAKQMLK